MLTVDVWDDADCIDCRKQRPRFVEAFDGHLAKRAFAAGNLVQPMAGVVDAGARPF